MQPCGARVTISDSRRFYYCTKFMLSFVSGNCGLCSVWLLLPQFFCVRVLLLLCLQGDLVLSTSLTECTGLLEPFARKLWNTLRRTHRHAHDSSDLFIPGAHIQKPVRDLDLLQQCRGAAPRCLLIFWRGCGSREPKECSTFCGL